MIFKEYYIHYIYNKEVIVDLENFINWLFTDGPQGIYVINRSGRTIKKSTITGTGTNAFVPVVKITISEFNDKISVNCSFVPFMALKIFSAIFLLFLLIMLFFLLIVYNSLYALVPTVMIALYLLMAYWSYNFFTKRCVDLIENQLKTIRERQGNINQGTVYD